MLNLRKRLPQLDRLIAFEAAARRLSFTLAAEELSLTQSAVSQQIRALERELGVVLFERGHRSIKLTERGEEFRHSVSVALKHLLNGASELRAGDSSARLTVATDNAIAGLWISPRLPAFLSRRPDIALRLISTDSFTDWFASAADIAIALGDGAFEGAHAELLFAEEVFAVCAPAYLDHTPISALEDLAGADLLDLEFDRWDWMDWATWLAAQDAPAPTRPRRLRANNYAHVIEAAKRGLGVALGWRRLVDADLLSGALVRPLAASLNTRVGYYVLWRAGRSTSAAAAAFRDWLIEARDAQKLAP